VHSHASHRRRRSRSASPLPLPPPRRRPPPPPPTAAHPRRATSRSGRGGTGSRGSSLRRRRDAGERHLERPDVRVHPWPPEEGEEEPVAAFTTAARLAGVPFGRRCGWKDWKKRAVAASVGRRPVALAGGDADGCSGQRQGALWFCFYPESSHHLPRDMQLTQSSIL
jgi:hypothetical protein